MGYSGGGVRCTIPRHTSMFILLHVQVPHFGLKVKSALCRAKFGDSADACMRQLKALLAAAERVRRTGAVCAFVSLEAHAGLCARVCVPVAGA